ncbi:alcohol dehydrogenase catalytic domain-containing protein [Vulcanisaeta souniana]|uniref:Alcohol dehydrogenase n=1 Tax=Vulcanisaeta souniana JCM 11219 TaxID=1293586 RepID=A0A830EER1_9CREN|nr:alcohol dehydrogenase catalytic domain-containing protein [Vulcanisaeta souniana]BDR93169.1 alcohol dehydrogenase [Vulcanisaeta souniana JCM 11219]GGI78187.1 alcohol dehydrogenase [Vulcanisaeta souniana JCM 11219]
MRAVVFDRPGMENVRVMDVEVPRPSPNEVLVRVKYAGVNPVDYFTINRGGKPMPHIPGAEFVGVIEEVGSNVRGVGVGDEVVIYNRLFDGTCRYCLVGHEELCVNSGLIGVVTNGGFAEYAVVPTTNVLKIPRGVGLDEAATLPVGALTAWHMVFDRAGVKPGELVVVFGATGNVGSYAVQFTKLASAVVIAVSRKASKVKGALMELGADYVVTPEEVQTLVNELSNGLGADLVVDAVGQATWNLSFQLVARYGRWVTAGALTGGDVTLSLPSLYSREVAVIGSTGGTRAELIKLLDLLSKRRIKAPIYSKMSLDRVREAFDTMFKAEDRAGKVLLAP